MWFAEEASDLRWVRQVLEHVLRENDGCTVIGQSQGMYQVLHEIGAEGGI